MTTREKLLLAGAFGALVMWLVLAAVVARYGRGKGFAFWPLFIATLHLGFPLVLLAIAIGAGIRQRETRQAAAVERRAGPVKRGSPAESMLADLSSG